MGRSAARYVRALGGSRAATGSSSGGRRATSGFAGFLSDVARSGFGAAFEKLGLGSYVGRDLDSVVAAVADAVCPAGGDLEEVAAREATAGALQEVFSAAIKEGSNADALDALSKAGVTKAVEAMVAGYIYNRWLGDLGAKIEEKAVSPRQAVQMENRMKEFIRDAVKLDLKSKDPLKVDWRGAEGRELINQIYGEAFAVIGGER